MSKKRIPEVKRAEEVEGRKLQNAILAMLATLLETLFNEQMGK